MILRITPAEQIAARNVALSAISLYLAATAIAGVTANSRDVDPSPPASPPSSPLPYSSLLTPQAVRQLQQLKEWNDARETASKGIKTCGIIDGSKDPAQTTQIRLCQAQQFYEHPLYKSIRNRYKVSISTQTLGGVLIEVFTPTDGVSAQNKDRVLINLHGGGFNSGSRTGSHVESIPISAVAKIKVVSVDYRMAPQFHFPAASEDVEAVYVQLLKKYDPANIGIFGCSAGGLLTAQSIAWLQKKNLPMPGAVGMFCAAGTYWSEGDSGNFSKLWQERPKTLADDPGFEYLKNEDRDNPLVYPARSKETISHFPPSLLITSTRDFALSSVVYTHSLLIQQGVPAELYVWEGLPHAFFMDSDLPQSREMYEITARFFDHHLGRTAATDHFGQPRPLRSSQQRRSCSD